MCFLKNFCHTHTRTLQREHKNRLIWINPFLCSRWSVRVWVWQKILKTHMCGVGVCGKKSYCVQSVQVCQNWLHTNTLARIFRYGEGALYQDLKHTFQSIYHILIVFSHIKTWCKARPRIINQICNNICILPYIKSIKNPTFYIPRNPIDSFLLTLRVCKTLMMPRVL